MTDYVNHILAAHKEQHCLTHLATVGFSSFSHIRWHFFQDTLLTVKCCLGFGFAYLIPFKKHFYWRK